MENVVSVVRGTDKLDAFRQLLELTDFATVLQQACRRSQEQKRDFKIAIKPNMMVFTNPKGHEAVVTDRELVECLVDRMIELGFTEIAICESQNDVGRMLKNHTVSFVAEQIGYTRGDRYRIVDLTLESETFRYP